MIGLELKHKEAVDELKKIEEHLIGLIANVNDELLSNKFLEWQQQRHICNVIYNSFIDETLKKNY
jgi:hypothetical protein